MGRASLPPLPGAIARFVGDARLLRDEIGESPCRVFGFERAGERFFLKWSPAELADTTYSVGREAAVTDWLQGRLGVPELVLAARDERGETMITRAVPGRPLAARIEAGLPVTQLFAEALGQLQSVPIEGCPFDAGIRVRLRELRWLIDHGFAESEPDFSPWPGILTPQDLLSRLHETSPAEELVFTHGDLGDSNVFVDEQDQLYFIDLGRAGLADRWLDIAFAHRNLREEISDAAAACLLDGLDMPDQAAKREFFEQLDELF